MTERVSGPAFFEALTTIRSSAWRWECQGVYHEPSEREPFAQFMRGEDIDVSFMDDWLAAIQQNVAAGKSYGRVRVEPEPVTDYWRFESSFTHLNIEAGEDIRVMTMSRARQLRLSNEDFWLLDDEQALVMHFTSNGVDYADVVTDPAKLDGFREIRDRAWQDARRFGELTT